MTNILHIGPEAQSALLEKVSDPFIKDRVIVLLGGVGNQEAVAAIIDAMISEDGWRSDPSAIQTNLCANLALTNITFADVIWKNEDSLSPIEQCQDNPKQCWSLWWKENQVSFKSASVDRSRYYRHYPNYGIYQRTNR